LRPGPLIHVRGLSRRFGAREVVRDLDLVLHAGDRVGLRGANGSGKTTIIRCVAGTLAPTRGDIRVAGYPAGSLEARRSLGISLSQERSFYLRLSGRENLQFFARLRGAGRREASEQVGELEQELELRHILDERVDRCSTGMVQQLALARSLLGDPPVLLLDEPTRSLDTAAIERLWATIDRRSGSAVLLATHREEDYPHCDTTIDLPV